MAELGDIADIRVHRPDGVLYFRARIVQVRYEGGDAAVTVRDVREVTP